MVLYTHTRASYADKILEVAVGTGKSARMFSSTFMKSGAVYVNTDISSKMIQLFQDNMQGADIIVQKQDSWTEIDPEEGKKQVAILKANNEDLPFADNYFNSYISNLSLQLVSNHKNQLLEAYRVLKKGGIAGFSVWGAPEKTRNFTFLKFALQKLGFDINMEEEIDGAFHLSDREQLRKDALDAGFKRVKVFITTAAACFENDDQFLSSMVKHGFEDFCGKKGIEGSSKEDLWAKVLEEFQIQFGDDSPDVVDFEINILIAHK
mmetsp:Transcript_28091/g.24819  ORF Transcript_28091/g.24819 Transcript_28091/m.24819 type:complete len:264 (+) Transcript_28091:58-849(+)